MEYGNLKVAVGIATAGRRDVLSGTIGVLTKQSLTPDEIFICPAKQEDVDEAYIYSVMPDVQVVYSRVGLTSQRNAILREAKADIIVFFDDDFLPAVDYLQQAVDLFRSNKSLAVATGNVVADGIHSEGLSAEHAISILGKAVAPEKKTIVNTYGGYGCNMVINLQLVRRYLVTFDEMLPLYSWLEDIDFSRQLAEYGEIVRCSSMYGVHLGTKSAGRTPGIKLGYSQIANPVYLAKKGTMGWRRALRHLIKNVFANIARSVWPEPWVDRRGRLSGNVKAMLDLLSGKLSPDRIEVL